MADLQLIAHAHAAVQLNRFLSDMAAGIGDLDLRRRKDAFSLDRIGRRIDLGAGEARHRLRLLAADDHVDHAMLQRLERADGRAELLSCLQVFERGVVGVFDRANGFRAKERCRVVDNLFDQRECLTFLADQCVGRHVHVLEPNVSGAQFVDGAIGFIEIPGARASTTKTLMPPGSVSPPEVRAETINRSAHGA